jgi:hypothetical protein
MIDGSPTAARGSIPAAHLGHDLDLGRWALEILGGLDANLGHGRVLRRRAAGEGDQARADAAERAT